MAEPLVWQAAQATAEKVRQLNCLPDGQVDLDRLCDRHGLRVTYTTEMPQGTSGLIVKAANQEPRIYINATEPMPRQRFTLAHEIGHYMERTTIAGDDDFAFQDMRGSGRYDLHEFYADQFAGALLMPLELVLRAAPGLRHDLSDFALSMAALDVADACNVSYSAAEHRLRRLIKQGDLKVAAA